MRWQRMSNRRLDLTFQVFAFLELFDFERYAEDWCAALQLRMSEPQRRIPRESIRAVGELQKTLLTNVRRSVEFCEARSQPTLRMRIVVQFYLLTQQNVSVFVDSAKLVVINVPTNIPALPFSGILIVTEVNATKHAGVGDIVDDVPQIGVRDNYSRRIGMRLRH